MAAEQFNVLADYLFKMHQQRVAEADANKKNELAQSQLDLSRSQLDITKQRYEDDARYQKQTLENEAEKMAFARQTEAQKVRGQYYTREDLAGTPLGKRLLMNGVKGASRDDLVKNNPNVRQYADQFESGKEFFAKDLVDKQMTDYMMIDQASASSSASDPLKQMKNKTMWVTNGFGDKRLVSAYDFIYETKPDGTRMWDTYSELTKDKSGADNAMDKMVNTQGSDAVNIVRGLPSVESVVDNTTAKREVSDITKRIAELSQSLERGGTYSPAMVNDPGTGVPIMVNDLGTGVSNKLVKFTPDQVARRSAELRELQNRLEGLKVNNAVVLDKFKAFSALASGQDSFKGNRPYIKNEGIVSPIAYEAAGSLIDYANKLKDPTLTEQLVEYIQNLQGARSRFERSDYGKGYMAEQAKLALERARERKIQEDIEKQRLANAEKQ